ncbi:hypothetical protein CYMTET_41839 [Cymbomonas tetramitiformis]|uniref:Uncharacterized protein n=1 Tax=Cymbomonas tetramitiformis TaxID=36881 RepID=A0AAE0C6M1_9CHLO|nr:hypothetical protein CYMTET_41839 [Cymbomonas tetramitiformis]
METDLSGTSGNFVTVAVLASAVFYAYSYFIVLRFQPKFGPSSPSRQDAIYSPDNPQKTIELPGSQDALEFQKRCAHDLKDVDVLEAAATSESPIVDQLQIETLQKTHTEQLREDEIRGISGGRASTGGGIGGAQRRAARASLSNLQTNAPVTKQAAQVEMQSLEKVKQQYQETAERQRQRQFSVRVPGNFCENLENSRQQQQQVKVTARQVYPCPVSASLRAPEFGGAALACYLAHNLEAQMGSVPQSRRCSRPTTVA